MANSVELVGAGWGALAGLSVGFLALLAWRARQHAAVSRPGPPNAPALVPRHHDAPLVTFESRQLDVEHEVSGVLAELQVAARQHQVELEVAVQPRLTVWADPCALRQILAGMLARAIERAVSGGVLITASWHGGRVQVCVIDDGPAADPARLAAALRQVEQCAALQGGTLEIACGKVRGTRVVLRMPGTSAADALATDEEDVSDEPTVRDAPWARAANVAYQQS
jgi:hypothetical protein